MANKGVVVDANILLRAVFGQRVRHILEQYEEAVNFYTPDACMEEADCLAARRAIRA